MNWTIASAVSAFILTVVLYSSTAAPTITRRFGGTDGGELAAVAVTRGVAHPPGYPSYLLLARAALHVPIGEPAGRIALLSAVCGALAAACTAALVTLATLRADSAPSALLAFLSGLYAALVMALGERLWSQAIIVEVYTTHLLALTLVALLGWIWLAYGRPLTLPAASLLLGLGLGIHPTLLALVPAGLVAFFVAPRRPPLSSRHVLASVVALLAGLAVYGFLPLWSAKEPALTWGDPATPSGFWAHVSAADYRYLVGVVPWSQRLSRIGFVSRDLLAQPGLVAVGLALWHGLPYGWKFHRVLVALTATVAMCNMLFAISYGGIDSTVYLLPWTWAWCIWAGLGIYAVVRKNTGAASARRALLLIALTVVFAISLLWPLLTHFRQLDLHADTSERERAIRQLEMLPHNAVLLTNTDATTFGAWYVQQVLHVRPDVVVIDTGLLSRPWYVSQIRRQMDLPPDQDVCTAIASWAGAVYRADPDGLSAPVTGTICPLDR